MINLSNFYPTGVEINSIVYRFGDQTISGIKNFLVRPTFNGLPLLISSDVPNLTNFYNTVNVTGNQDVYGLKKFENITDIDGNPLLASGIGKYNEKYYNIVLYSGRRTYFSPKYRNSYIFLNFLNVNTYSIHLPSVTGAYETDYIKYVVDNLPLPSSGLTNSNEIDWYVTGCPTYDFPICSNCSGSEITGEGCDQCLGSCYQEDSGTFSGSFLNQSIYDLPISGLIINFYSDGFITGSGTYTYNPSGLIYSLLPLYKNSVSFIFRNGYWDIESERILLQSPSDSLPLHTHIINDIVDFPQDIVYTSGSQIINGEKIFLNNLRISGSSPSGQSIQFLNQNENQTILLGRSAISDNGFRIFSNSGTISNVCGLNRGGVIQGFSYNYGIIFSGSNQVVSNGGKGYLTRAISSTGISNPFSIEHATLVWTDRILSGNWVSSAPIRVGDAIPVMTTGDQNISGSKNFNIKPTVNGVSILLSGEADAQVLSTSVVYLTGDQNISGIKNFKNSIVLNDNLLYISESSGYLSGNNYTGSYDNGFFLGKLKITQNNNRLVNFGETWLEKETNRNWRDVAISADGKYQTAIVNEGGIYVSNDYGNTWVARDTNKRWYAVAMTPDGKYQVAVVNGEFVYISKNYGIDWVQNSFLVMQPWYDVAISDDGKYIIVCADGGAIYISHNYGLTFSVPFVGSRQWYAVAISSDGKYQIALESSGPIYQSNDYGLTWYPGGFGLPNSYNWRATSMSSDGKYRTVVAGGLFSIGGVFISSDYGARWEKVESDRNWIATSMSYDGKYQFIISHGNHIYVSSNYGKTWQPKGNTTFWRSISVSSDAKYQTAIVANGKIYTSAASELIPGEINFDTRPKVSGIGVLLQGEAVGGIVENAVYTTGNQTISGTKNFITRPTVNNSGVLLQGEVITSLFNGNRAIKQLPVIGTNYSGTTISGFLENMFFPYINATITLRDFIIRTYGINQITVAQFPSDVVVNDNTITGISYYSGETLLAGPTPLTVGGFVSTLPFNLQRTLNTSTDLVYTSRIHVITNIGPQIISSSPKRIRFEPRYYYGASNNSNLSTGISGLLYGEPTNYTYNFGSKPSNVVHALQPNNQYIYFAYPSPDSTQDGIINWGNTLTSIFETNTNFEYIGQYSQLTPVTIAFPFKSLQYRIYRSNDLITLGAGQSLNLRFTFGG